MLNYIYVYLKQLNELYVFESGHTTYHTVCLSAIRKKPKEKKNT